MSFIRKITHVFNYTREANTQISWNGIQGFQKKLPLHTLLYTDGKRGSYLLAPCPIRGYWRAMVHEVWKDSLRLVRGYGRSPMLYKSWFWVAPLLWEVHWRSHEQDNKQRLSEWAIQPLCSFILSSWPCPLGPLGPSIILLFPLSLSYLLQHNILRKWLSIFI